MRLRAIENRRPVFASISTAQTTLSIHRLTSSLVEVAKVAIASLMRMPNILPKKEWYL
jgi:hypothetical protein